MKRADDPSAASRTLEWPHGRAELQRLGAMLAPVSFRAPNRPDFAPLQVAPWADEPGNGALPGLLRRLRGEWPCVPFGRTDRPDGLPADWTALTPEDDFAHGHGAHHDWTWLPSDDPLELRLGIDYPLASPIRRLTRSVRALADAPALSLALEVEARHPCVLPIALHPVIRLDAGRVDLTVRARDGGLSYPVAAEPGASRLRTDTAFAALHSVPTADGGTLDLSRYPLPVDTEELLLLRSVETPVTARFVDRGWSLQLDWDHAALPDMMLWVSHRGRRHAPWNGRHWALGLEPVNGLFDLGRVARPPQSHPLAPRRGVALAPASVWRLRAELRASPCP